jgi:hypothetical protein
MTEIRASPESDGCSIRVSLELRNGTWSLRSTSVRHQAKEVDSTHFFPFDAFSASVAITLPRVSKLNTNIISDQDRQAKVTTYLVLMNFPSRVRSLSEVAFSDPAKSIKLSTLVCTLLPPIDCSLGPPGVGGRDGMPGVCRPPLVSPRSRLSITTRNTLWLRLLRSFQSVLAVRRAAQPRAITARTPARLVTTSSRSGASHTFAPLPWSCTAGADEGASRS